MIRTVPVQHLVRVIVILACAAGGAAAQEGDRTAVLREVLRATVLAGYPWARPSPTVVSPRTTGACGAQWCPGADSGTLPDTLQRFVRDSLHSAVVGPASSAGWDCQADRAPGLITLAEPGFRGDSAFVGVAWQGCVRSTLVPTVVPREVGHAIILLLRGTTGWKIAGMTEQTISLAPAGGARGENRRAPPPFGAS